MISSHDNEIDISNMMQESESGSNPVIQNREQSEADYWNYLENINLSFTDLFQDHLKSFIISNCDAPKNANKQYFSLRMKPEEWILVKEKGPSKKMLELNLHDHTFLCNKNPISLEYAEDFIDEVFWCLDQASENKVEFYEER